MSEDSLSAQQMGALTELSRGVADVSHRIEENLRRQPTIEPCELKVHEGKKTSLAERTGNVQCEDTLTFLESVLNHIIETNDLLISLCFQASGAGEFLAKSCTPSEKRSEMNVKDVHVCDKACSPIVISPKECSNRKETESHHKTSHESCIFNGNTASSSSCATQRESMIENTGIYEKVGNQSDAQTLETQDPSQRHLIQEAFQNHSLQKNKTRSQVRFDNCCFNATMKQKRSG